MRYLSVIASVIVALAVRYPFERMLNGRSAFVTLFPAVLYSAVVAGWRGGLLATILASLGALFIIFPESPLALFPEVSRICSLVLFIVVALAMSLIAERERTARKEALESAASAQESEHRKSAVLEVALDAIITIDQNGCITEFNPAAERIFGYKRTEVMGNSLAETIIPPRFRHDHAKGMHTFINSGVGPILNRRIEVVGIRKGGEEFPAEVTIAPVKRGDVYEFTGYLRDISDVKAREAEREQLIHEISVNADMQKRFLRDVLASVTDGRLILCYSEDELPKTIEAGGEWISLTLTSGLSEIRKASAALATLHGFETDRAYDIATASSEGAMNAIVHAGGGNGYVCGNDSTIQVWIVDQGTGIDVAQLPRATLEKGYTTAGTLGHGMKIMLHTADRVFLLTNPEGTTLVIEEDRLSRAPQW